MKKKTYQAHDVVTLTSRRISDEGYLIAPVILARTGVQLYRAYELGLDAAGMDPMRLIRLYRPPEEVFDPESMASFESKPVTIDHPPVSVTSDNWSEYARGEVRDVVRSGELMAANILIKAQEAIDAVEGGKVEVSNGYRFELDLTPGQSPQGEDYDGIQQNIRGNHIALVDAARCGSACRIADSQLNLEGTTMPDKRKVVIDGIPLEVEDTAAGVIETLIKQRDAATTQATDAQQALATANDGHVAALAAKDAEIEALRKEVMTPEARDAMVAEWAKLLEDAKRLAPTVTTDGKTCVQIRREVISTVAAKDGTAKAVADAVLAGTAVDAASADVLRATFNALVASVKPADANDALTGADAALADALTGAHQSNANDSAQLVGRARFLASQANGWNQ